MKWKETNFNPYDQINTEQNKRYLDLETPGQLANLLRKDCNISKCYIWTITTKLHPIQFNYTMFGNSLIRPASIAKSNDLLGCLQGMVFTPTAYLMRLWCFVEG